MRRAQETVISPAAAAPPTWVHLEVHHPGPGSTTVHKTGDRGQENLRTYPREERFRGYQFSTPTLPFSLKKTALTPRRRKDALEVVGVKNCVSALYAARARICRTHGPGLRRRRSCHDMFRCQVLRVNRNVQDFVDLPGKHARGWDQRGRWWSPAAQGAA